MTSQQTIIKAQGAHDPAGGVEAGGRGVVQLLAASANANFADKIAAALLRAGYKLDPGDFDPARIDACVVLWTGVALDKPKLVAAAREAWKAGRLAPVSIGRVEPPFGAKESTPMDLAGWRGDDEDPRWRFVLADLDVIKARAAIGGAAPLSNAPAGLALNDDVQRVYHPARQLWRQRIRPATVPFAAGMALISAAGIAAFTLGANGDPTARQASATAPDRAAPQQVERAAPVAAAPVPVEPSVDEANVEAEPVDGATLHFVAPVAGAEPETESVFEVAADLEIAATDEDGEEIGIELDALPPGFEAIAAPSVKPAPQALATLVEPLVAETAEAGADLNQQALDALTQPSAAAQPVAASVSSSDRSGDFFSDCAMCPEMAALGGGGFAMGAAPGERDAQLSESPQRWVYIDYRFAISRREVTFDQWSACVADGGCQAHMPSDAGWGRGAQPVINVSFEDASAYARWLSAKTGKYYRLPSEAEWEFAARAGRESAFAFGAALGADHANINGLFPAGAPQGVFRERTMRVGSFAPNSFGLYDMHGNVWEWTSDCWRESHHGGPATGAARIDGDCARRVIKGGGWNSPARDARSAHRRGADQLGRTSDTGFRVVRDLGGAP